jgi:hypothetical protein
MKPTLNMATPNLVKALPSGWRMAALSLTFALSQACSAADQAQPPEEDATATTAEALRGTTTQQNGIVFLATWHGRCSAFMLGPQLIATAGHCIAPILPAGSKSGVVNVSLAYTAQDGQHHSFDTDVQADLWPDFTDGMDAEDDVAILRPTDGKAWAGTGTPDYAYIYTDTMSAYSRYQAFGYGANGFDGSGVGTLRTGTFALDWYGNQQFHLTMSGARLCKGDSGGPGTVYLSTTTPELHVAGVQSDLDEVTPSGYCGADGSFARFSRLSAKVDWIRSVTGIPCTAMKSQVTNKSVTRCFPYTRLKRTVYDCRTRTALGPEQSIDLTTGYSNYKCGSRYQEQCVDDGTPDIYYVEHCE